MMTFIVTGERGGGKTSFLEQLAQSLRKQDVKVGGFISPGLITIDGNKDFDIMDITGKTKMPLSSRSGKENYLDLGKFYFNPEALIFGEKIIGDAMNENCDILIMDEIGPVELNQNAWFRILKKVIYEYNGTLVLSVRRRLVEAVIRKFSLKNAEIIDINMFSPINYSSIFRSINPDVNKMLKK